MDALFAQLTAGQTVGPREVPVAFGRSLKVPACSKSVCRFDFETLCGDREPVMGVTDFQALCRHFDIILIDNVPVLEGDDHNYARRFVTLLDQMYDRGVGIVMSAAAPPSELFRLDYSTGEETAVASPALISLQEMRTASKRAISRITEMTSQAA
eukprot:scaffold31_cov263-Pinguiococcus_pyrenoidosus.AAC.45